MKIVTIQRDERERLRHELRDADSITLRYLPLDADDLRTAQNLKVIARHGVGYDNIDMVAAGARGIPIATIGDANSVTVAELALYLILATANTIAESSIDRFHSMVWQGESPNWVARRLQVCNFRMWHSLGLLWKFGSHRSSIHLRVAQTTLAARRVHWQSGSVGEPVATNYQRQEPLRPQEHLNQR